MNEPVLPRRGQTRTDWLAGAFAGKHFVQYLSLDLQERTRPEVAKRWVDQFIEASRAHVEGWIGFYWGKTREEYGNAPSDIKSAKIKAWWDYFVEKGLSFQGVKD